MIQTVVFQVFQRRCEIIKQAVAELFFLALSPDSTSSGYGVSFMSLNLLFLSPPIKGQLWKTSELSAIMAEDRTVLHIPHVLLTSFLDMSPIEW